MSAEQSDWKYVDLISNGTLRISAHENEVAFSEHVIDEWIDCDTEREKYVVCFVSARLTMKLPHDALDDREWTEEGTRYTAVYHEDMQLLGQAIGGYYVVLKEGQGKQGFIYSPERGVVSIFSSRPESFEIGLVDSKCGYGAPDRCYDDLP